jgi:hypothetical protein
MYANDRLAAPLHVLAILAVGLATVLPSYYIADMAAFRPTRALGPLVCRCRSAGHDLMAKPALCRCRNKSGWCPGFSG